MGGGGSKNVKKEITFDYKPTKIPKIDQKFNEAQGLFKRAEELRAGLDNCRLRVLTLTKANWLKASEEEQFQEAVKVFFWGLSAETGGRIAATGIKIFSDYPNIELNPMGRSTQVVDVYSNLTAFINAVYNYANVSADLKKKLSDVTAALNEFKKTYKAEAKAAGLTAKDTSAGQTALNQNIKRISQETVKVNDLPNLGAKVGPIWKATAAKLIEFYNGADVIGQRAFAELLAKTNPPSQPNLAQIFDTYSTGTKKTQEEIDWENNPKNKGKKYPEKKSKGKTDPKQAQQPATQPQSNAVPNTQVNPNQPNTQILGTNPDPNTQVPNSNIITNPNLQSSTDPVQNNPNFGGNLQQSTNLQSNQYNINSTGTITNQGQQFGTSPFSNQGFATPSKKSNKEEDIFDEEEETRQPVVRHIQESNMLHQSSIKRQKYIKTSI